LSYSKRAKKSLDREVLIQVAVQMNLMSFEFKYQTDLIKRDLWFIVI